MDRLKLATVWLGGCSGCHMSFLDLDEWLIELAGMADVVYTPLADRKDYPQGVDVGGAGLAPGIAAAVPDVVDRRRARSGREHDVHAARHGSAGDRLARRPVREQLGRR